MTPQTLELVLSIAFLILSLGIHEAAHAWVAYLCGDPTARDEGRLTLNPMAHIDPIMTIAVPLFLYLTSGFIFGGARPVPVNTYRLRHPLRDMMFVALAGPISNFLLAILFSVAWKLMIYTAAMPTTSLAPTVMLMAVRFNIILAIFNMLPVPPLDGSRVMAYLLPSNLRETYVTLERYGMLLIVALLVSGALHFVLNFSFGPMLSLVDTITGSAW